MVRVVLLLSFIVASSFLEARQIVDSIVARVNGSNILKSDLQRPRIASKIFNLEEAVYQELYLQEAARLKMVPSILEVEKQIAAYRSGEGLKDASNEEFEQHLKTKEGFSLSDFKREYTRYIANASLLNHQIKSRVFVTAQEVEAAHNKYPLWEEESYKLKTAIIPYTRAQTEAAVVSIKDIDWVSHDDWIRKSSIASNMSVIFQMKKGSTSKPIKTKYGFQLIHLVDKKPRRKKTLEESYVEREKKIRDSKMAKFESEYRQELKDKATIVYLR